MPLNDRFWRAEADALFESIESVMVDMAEDAVTAARRLAAQSGGGTVGIDWELVNQRAVEEARSYAYELVQGITQTSREATQEAIAAWLESGGGLADLTDSLAGIYGESRAELIAVTEVTRAFQQANAVAWGEAGLKRFRYNTAEDGLVCPLCTPHDGKEFDLDDAENSPPLHPGCRCFGTPVVAA